MARLIGRAISLVIQMAEEPGTGRRLVTNVYEITGMENDVITMQDIFLFERSGLAQNGRVLGRFRATGIRPRRHPVTADQPFMPFVPRPRRCWGSAVAGDTGLAGVAGC